MINKSKNILNAFRNVVQFPSHRNFISLGGAWNKTGYISESFLRESLLYICLMIETRVL